jgi:MFS family permease
MRKLRKAGLFMMLSSGVVFILFFIIAIGISGDMVLVGNLLMGFLMGSMYGGPLLLLSVAARRWPFWDRAVAIGFSVLAMLVYGILGSVVSEYPPNPILTFLYFPLMIISLIGSILIFTSARKSKGQVVEGKEYDEMLPL